MTNEAFLNELDPILKALPGIDLHQPPKAAASLNRMFPLDSPLMLRLRELFDLGCEEKWLCTREVEGVFFSRVSKAVARTGGFSVDAVRMSGPGVWHRHPKGEIDLCFAAQEHARFDDEREGFVIKAPGSDHVPTVTGGEMSILYFLPGGEIEWAS